MKNKYTSRLLVSLFACLLMWTWPAGAVTSPSEVKINIYGVAISQNSDCSNPTILFNSDVPSEVDFVTNPVLGAGAAAIGTYPCVIIKMSDLIKFRPAANDGATCVANTEYSIDLCRSNTGVNDNNTESFDGTVTTCAGTSQTGGGAAANIVYLHLSTASTSAGNSWRKPSHNGGTGGITLSSPLVISASIGAKFKADFRNQVSGAGASCDVNAPVFGFSKN